MLRFKVRGIRRVRMPRFVGLVAVVLVAALISATLLPVQVSITGEGVLSIEPREVGAQVVELEDLRDRTSKTYYLGGNRYALDVGIGSAHYQDELGDWQEIDNQWSVAQEPWDWEMVQDGYHTSVLEDFTAGQILLFESQGERVAFQPMALEWTNDLDQIAQISMPQNVAASVSNEAVELLPGMMGSISKIRWDNGYGTGRHFEWENTPGRLGKLLTLDNSPPAPPQYIIDGGSPVLRLNFIFDPSAGLNIYLDGVLWDRKSREQSFSTIEFRKDEEVLWGFMPVVYWDSAEEEGEVGATELRKVGNSLYVSVRVPYEWLQTATYPVFIDPTLDLQVGASLDDSTEKESTGAVYEALDSVMHNSRTVASQRYWGGYRWENAELPNQGDTIDVAYAEIYIFSITNDDVNGNWHFEKAASPAQFSSSNYDITGRTRTSASMSWIQDALGIGWKGSGISLVTPLQEVVNSYSPTALVLIFRPNQDASKAMQSRSYDYDPNLAAWLHIEWTAGGACSPSIEVSKSTWDVNGGSPVSEDTIYSTGLTWCTITNNSGGAVSITIGGTDMTGGAAWDLSDDGSNGNMIYGMYSGLEGGSYSIVVKESGPYNTLVSGLADEGTQDFGLQLETPTNFSDGAAKSGTVTLTVTCD